ncbi:MAG TPA: RimK family protein [Rhodanobacteraceae bacterium]|nr:RimK family protein [Rhodanobacteraceae bacterium]
MSRLIIVVEKASDWNAYYPSADVVDAMDYLRETDQAGEGAHVINLCRNYRYLGTGYYVSLLAEARGQRVIPSVRTINDLRRRALYGIDVEDLNQKLKRFLPVGGGDTTALGILVHFGDTSYPSLQDLARQVFELFPCPLLRIEFEYHRVWQIAAIRPVGFQTLDGTQEDTFAQALDRFSRRLWRKPRARRQFRFDLAMLCDAEETLPPSDPRALKRFVAAGRQLGIDVDPIGKDDYARLAEYDGLFIRETTGIDHHTYRFAHKAEREGMVVIDDPTSIARCTNKIYLHDLLRARHLPTPRGEILYHKDTRQLRGLAERLPFPLVLKIPDGSFSRGVVKVEDAEQLEQAAAELFHHSALLIAQEFMYTEFDWRIGVLAGKPLYACQYFMSRGHWQIYNHSAAKGADRTGGYRAVPLDEAPRKVVQLALRATRAIGDGLYGVDIKQTPARTVVIEVNDNPSIDAGVEDSCEGEAVYRAIMAELLKRMERKRLGQAG